MTAAQAQQFQVSDGAALLPAIAQWVAEVGQQSGWIRGFGTLSHCTFRSADGTRQIGPAPELALASLDVHFFTRNGQLEFRASAVVGVDAHGVHATAAGELTEATALDVVLALVGGSFGPESGGHAAASRKGEAPRPGAGVAEPAKTASKRSSAAVEAPRRKRDVPPRAKPGDEMKKKAAAPASSPADWAQVSAMSQKIQSGALDEYENDIDVDELKPNDILMHPSLNRCLVVRVEGDDAVRVRVPNGSVRKLMMRPFRLVRTETPHTFRIQKK